MTRTAPRIVMDVGNTRTKCGLFIGGRLSRQTVVPVGDGAALSAFVGKERPDAVVVGVVAAEEAWSTSDLERIAPVIRIDGNTPSHLNNRYTDRTSLGVDRWANAVAASLLFPGRPVAALGLGTCFTCDVVTNAGAYIGGSISPGFRMRSRAMAHFTARLPEVDPPGSPIRWGGTTLDSLAAGTHHGLRAELRQTIHELRASFPGIGVVLTGGDALRFARALENGIFAHPFLTLFGLYALSFPPRAAAGLVDP